MLAGTGRLEVFTFKAGVLSRLAHDLQFSLEAFPVSLEGEEVRAEIPLAELRLVGPVVHGRAQPDAYEAGRRDEVEQAMREGVLRLSRHPTAQFLGRAVETAGGYDVEGTLTLAGVSAPLAFAVSREESVYRASVELQPT